MYGYLWFEGTQTLGGNGTVIFERSPSNSIYNAGSGTGEELTIGPEVIIRGASGSLQQRWQGSIVNQGTLAADRSVGPNDWGYDFVSPGGYVGAVGTDVDTSASPDAVDQRIYQRYREANFGDGFQYQLDGLEPGETYELRLHFAEYWAGNRTFDVSINGDEVLSDFSIESEAGGLNRALVRKFDVVTSSEGLLLSEFSAANSYAMLNGIELFLQETPVNRFDIGNTPSSVMNISVNEFANNHQIRVGPGSVLTFNSGVITGKMAAATGGTVELRSDATLDNAVEFSVEIRGIGEGGFGQLVLFGSGGLDGTAAVGLSTIRLEALGAASFFITELAGSTLALATARGILIDAMAAGYGWFVDLTPSLTNDFVRDKPTGRYFAKSESEASGKVDLLTVLSHELGHLLGLEDHARDPADLLFESLASGERKQVQQHHVDAVMLNW